MPYVQIGVQALRAPDGSFLPSTPIYTEVPEVNEAGITPTTDRCYRDIVKYFAKKFAAEQDAKAF